ncbi:pentapeptide repeat-containing protein [Streptomyces cacaoi]|uniref:pentapeptide repeat-containing protein n=1 Tax=Streptomyces cacaoi TaxID=1898 RepID=UPI003749C921
MKPKTKRIVLSVLAVTVVGYALLLWKGPWWIDGDHLRTKDLEPADGVVITGFRTTLVALGAGALAALGLYYTHRSHRQSEALFEHTRDKDREQAELTREGQVTDRYVEAIKLLASKSLTERLGGIYSLERIMRDSVKDHETVIQVLAAFVRQHSTFDPDVEAKTRPADDVQAALHVIGRRPEREEVSDIDLRRINLRGADLAGARLNNAILTDAHLERANLSRASLKYANLSGAHLPRAQLIRSHLERANLAGADLTRAQLSHAHLQKACLAGAQLIGADLESARLDGVWMVRASCERAYLKEASLEGAYLRKVDLATARDLTAGQLVEAYIYNLTKLPPELEENAQVKARIAECYPPGSGFTIPAAASWKIEYRTNLT